MNEIATEVQVKEKMVELYGELMCPACNDNSEAHVKVFKVGVKCFKCGEYTSLLKHFNTNDSKVGNWNNRDNVFRAELSLDDKDKLYRKIFDGSELTKKDYRYLRSRGLTENEIEDRMFKSSKSFVKRFDNIASQQSNDVVGKFFGSLPGVFFDEEENKYRINNVEGIVFPIMQDNKIIACQVRTNMENYRYMWLSSVSKGGAKTGAPFDLIINDKCKNGKAIVTEGVFKSLSILKEFEDYEYIYSVQGIGNTFELIDDINLKVTVDKINTVDIAYDSDITREHPGYAHMKHLSNSITFTVNKSRLVWDSSYKGIDDLINAGLKDSISKRSI